MAANIAAEVKPGDPTEAGEPRKFAAITAGTVEVAVYESLITPGLIIVDIDAPDDGRTVAVTVNDGYVFDGSGTKNAAQLDDDDETDGDMNVRPRTVCGCGYQLVWTDGEWQHDAAPSLWGNDHDPDAEPPAEGEGRWHWDEADCIDREILALPVVASEAEIPEGLLPDGVGYHEGLPFNGVLEAITAATALLGEHDGVVYFDICEGSESSRIVRVDRDGVQKDGV